MALTKITSNVVKDDAVTSAKIVDGGIATADIAANAVTSAKIAQNSILTKHIDDGQVTTDQLGADAVTNAKIANQAIGPANLSNTIITDLTAVTAATGDLLMVADISDSNNLKKIPVSSILLGNAATATTAGTVTTAAQSAITSLGTLTTLTVDDITINGSTISDSGDLTLDLGGDLIIDVDGDNVWFDAAGTRFLSISQVSSDVYIGTEQNDKDLIFRGKDGSSTITALTLDMSEAGAATFNSSITSGAITSSGLLTLNDNYAMINAGTTSNTTLEPVIWARSQVGASVVQMNVQGDEWQFGGGGTLDTTPILKLKYGTNVATFAGTVEATRLGLGVAPHASAALNITTTNQHMRLNNGSELGIISLESDGALRIWSHGDSSNNEIEFYQGTGSGSASMTINGSGNVGIGTDAPQQRLEVGGSGANIYLGNNSADTNFIHTGGCLGLSADTDIYITADANDTSSATPPAGVIVFGGGSNTDTDSNLNFTEAEFGNNGAPRVEYARFHSNGFFGLNTTPGVELDIKRKTNAYPLRIGSSQGEGRAMVFADIHASPSKYNWLVGSQYNIDNSFEITPSTAVGGYTFSTPGILVKQDGKVGIGETIPLAKLHVREGDSGQGTINSNFDQLCLEDDAHAGMTILSGSNSNDGAIYFGDVNSNDVGQIKYKHGTDTLAFTTSGAEQLTLYQTQNGGITEGYLKLASIDSATLIINADTDNSEEDGVPTLDFKMDGSQTRLKVGVDASNNPYISTQSDIALPLQIKTGTSGNNRVYINDTGMQISDGTAGAPDHMLQLVHEGNPVDDRTFISIVNGSGTGDIGTPESHIDFEFFDTNSNQFPQARISVGTGNYPGQDANTQILEGEGYITLRTNDATNSNATEVDPAPALIARGDGGVQIAYDGTNDRAGYLYVGKDWGATNHRINRGVSQGGIILVISAYNSSGQDTALFYGCSGQDASSSAAGLRMQKNSSTNRSINAAGTINASGSDYAEYVKKSDTCGAIAKGDICGIDANSKLTDKWSEAHSFVVKSTDPSYVGGDTWGTLTKPELTKRGYVDIEKPAPETKEEYAARKTKYETDLAAFETALEAERVKYDRIAFSGQVPCNLTGASVGDYIIPKQGTSDTITGEAVSSPTFEQYQKAVGKVWKVLDNGNAWISVKIG